MRAWILDGRSEFSWLASLNRKLNSKRDTTSLYGTLTTMSVHCHVEFFSAAGVQERLDFQRS